jgi:N-acetyl-gamma-glutamylphosphate reductase
MNKKVIIIGASGMIGGIILNLCINDNSISEIISLVRKPSGIKHDKLNEIVISDFLNYDACAPYFANADVV